MVWILAGCGLLLLVGICSLGGVGMWLAMEQGQQDPFAGPGGFGPAPDPTPAPRARPRPPPAAPSPSPSPSPSPAPAPSGPSGPSEPPRVVVATVTSVDGSRPVREGTTCGFTVERHPRDPSGYWCRTQVVCGGKLLYGGPRAGYFPCTWHRGGSKDVVGGEDGTTSEDSDAAFELDTRNDTVTIRDDDTGTHGAYRLQARVDRVR